MLHDTCCMAHVACCVQHVLCCILRVVCCSPSPRPALVMLAFKLNDCAGIRCSLPDGAFYAYPSIDGCIGKTSEKGFKIINDEVFDSSIDRGEPASFQVGGVIKGWSEALQLMKEGAKWKLVDYDEPHPTGGV